MKKRPFALTLFSLGSVLLLPTLASAATAITGYAEGDLLLGFRQIGTGAQPNDLLVDIGPASLFINATVPFTLSFGVVPGTSTAVTNLNSDLTSLFGANWASNTASNPVQFGVFGDTTVAGTFGLPKNTLFLTTGELTAGTFADPLLRFRSIASGTYAGTINSATVGQFGYNGSISTTNSSVAVSQPNSQPNSYAAAAPGSNAFGTGYDIEQPASGTATGPTNSVLDLYELRPDTQEGDPGILLGTFRVNSAGVATFTPVPEPGSLTLLGAGLAGWLGLARRRRPSPLSAQS